MDRDHRMEAPDNEALRGIEQLPDHSDLTTIYRRARNQYDGIEIMSRDEREKKKQAEQLRISLSLRKWFVPIGLLIPLPFLTMTLLVAFANINFDGKAMGFLMLPIMIGVGFLLFATYKGFVFAYKIFYTHGTKALPFVVALLGLLGLSLHGIFLLTEPLHTGNHTIDMFIIGGAVLVTSVVYSFIMTFVWSSPRISAGLKIGIVGIMALLIGAGTGLLYLV